ncbi:TVP38/TMEM64 family protein [Natronorubrum sp. FCH18a]|uniref:TVP38/TMEM64 family protein n=1 Tax=Natronorubrum sp. FCH18a TaxID=3447018 RepID=UPI003F5186F6
MSLSSVKRRALVGTVVIGAIVAMGVLVSPSTILGAVESVSADPYLFGLVVGGLYLVRPLLVLPTTPLAVVVGYGYGVALGLPIALVGVVTTVIPVFLVARWLAGTETNTASGTHADSAAESAGGTFESLLERAGSVGTRYYDTAGPTRGVVVSRLAPIPSDVSTCAAAVSGVRLRQFVVGTVVGELPWTVAAVVVGASAATVTTDGFGEFGATLTVACLGAAVILLAGPAYRVVRMHRRARNAGRSAES